MCTEDLQCLTQISKRVGKIESKPCMHCEYCSLISVAFCWIQKFNLLPKYMLCWIGIVSNATIKYGCVIKYVFVYIGTMMSCIYFQRVVAVLMKGVDEGNEECPSSSTSRKMLKMTWKDRQYVNPIMQRLVKRQYCLNLQTSCWISSGSIAMSWKGKWGWIKLTSLPILIIYPWQGDVNHEGAVEDELFGKRNEACER